MMRHSNTYKNFDIVAVPFPFTAGMQAKKRPALIVSLYDFYNNFVNHSVLAMITSASHSTWPHDIEISDPKVCGLQKTCVIRFNLFTLSNRLIHYTIGKLSPEDRIKV